MSWAWTRSLAGLHPKRVSMSSWPRRRLFSAYAWSQPCIYSRLARPWTAAFLGVCMEAVAQPPCDVRRLGCFKSAAVTQPQRLGVSACAAAHWPAAARTGDAEQARRRSVACAARVEGCLGAAVAWRERLRASRAGALVARLGVAGLVALLARGAERERQARQPGPPRARVAWRAVTRQTTLPPSFSILHRRALSRQTTGWCAYIPSHTR